MAQGYGIDITTLDQFIGTPQSVQTPWGSETSIFARDEYMLRRVDIIVGKSAAFTTGAFELTIFVEEGSVVVNGATVKVREVLSIPPHTPVIVEATQKSVLYFFEGPQDPVYVGTYGTAQPTTDVREKYWGRIETMVSRAYAGKRIFCQTDKHASLEYHCQKIEGYYIHSGSLLVRLRAGRGEDTLFELTAGQTMFIPPGLMHQRGGRKDAVVIEISTHDDDADSFLVEDGQRMPMPGLLTK